MAVASPILPVVEKGWKQRVHICRGADEEEDDEEKRLEVKKRRLPRC